MRLVAFLVAASFAFPAQAKRREVEDTITLKGKKTQRWRGYHENGKPWYVHYWRGGKKVGVHVDYYESGQMRSSVTYRRDVMHGTFNEWHRNGQLSKTGKYRDGAEDGRIETFHENGSPDTRRTYADTLPDGELHVWYDNGHKRFEGQYAKGQPTGTWRHWSKDRRVIAERVFQNGAWVEPAAKVRATGGVVDAPDFALFLVTGGALEGYDFQVWIHPNGAVDLLRLQRVPRVAKKSANGLKKGTFYYDTRSWHTRLWLTDADWAGLSSQLQRLGPFDLPPKVINKNVHDGTQWHFGIRANGKTHRVYCSNDFPPALKRFGKWLRERMESEDYAFERLGARADEKRTWRRMFDFTF